MGWKDSKVKVPTLFYNKSVPLLTSVYTNMEHGAAIQISEYTTNQVFFLSFFLTNMSNYQVS